MVNLFSVILLLLFSLPLSANHLGTQIPPGGTWKIYNDGNAGIFPDSVSACTYNTPVSSGDITFSYSRQEYVYSSSAGYGYQCYWTRSDNNQEQGYRFVVSEVASCNIGYTQSGGYCIRAPCTAPQEWDDTLGQCKDPVICPAAGAAGAATGQFFSTSGSNAPASLCVGGCSFAASNLWVCVAGPPASCYGSGGMADGQTCSGSDTPSQTDAQRQCTDKQQCPFSVNGVTTCVSCDSSSDTSKKEESPARNPYSSATSSQTVTNPDGSVTKTDKTYRYNPDGSVVVDKVTTTTYPDGSTSVAKSSTTIQPAQVKTPTTDTVTRDTKNTDGTITRRTDTTVTHPDGDKISTSKDETKSAPKFCADNPDSPICKKSSISDGDIANCDTPPVCDGDVISCSVAKSSWQDYCESRKLSKEFASNPYRDLVNTSQVGGDQAAIDKASNRSGSADLNIYDRFLANRQTYISWASACISSAGFDFKGVHYAFDLSFLCQIGDFIRILLQMVAFVSVIKMFARE